MNVAPEISCYKIQKTCLADYLGKEQERGNRKNGLQIHQLTDFDLLNGADYHGYDVAQNCSDLWRDDILGNKAPRKEHSDENNCQ